MELNEWPEKVTLSLTKLNPNLSSSSQHRINEVVNYVIAVSYTHLTLPTSDLV